MLPSQTNFICFQLPDPTYSKEFFEYLLAKGCVLRHTENFKGLNGKWFRVGMKEKSQMEFLQKEMSRMVRGKLIFITGGVRSGKSSFAEHYLMNERANRNVYIASGVAVDDEMTNV